MAVAVLDRRQATIASAIRVRPPEKSAEIPSFIDPGVLKVEVPGSDSLPFKAVSFAIRRLGIFAPVPKNNRLSVNDQMVMKGWFQRGLACSKSVHLVKDQAKLKRTK